MNLNEEDISKLSLFSLAEKYLSFFISFSIELLIVFMLSSISSS